MHNPIIIGGVLLQGLVRRASRTAGAIVGFLITTVLLLWGLGAYAEGSAMTFVGIELSQPVFVGMCVVWYIFDAGELVEARKQAPRVRA
jgi:hypothetical protein